MEKHNELEEVEITDYILAVLLYSRSKALSRLKIMKILATFAKLTGREEFFDFAPYRMGLYSPEVNSLIDELLKAGIIQRTRYGYMLTEKGLEAAQLRVALLQDRIRDDAEVLKKLTRRMEWLRKDELLLFHYVVVCDEICRESSDEWKKIEKKRVQIALDMLRKRKVSWRLAARLAGMTIEEFVKYAEERGVIAGDKIFLEDIEAAKRDVENLLRTRRKYSYHS